MHLSQNCLKKERNGNKLGITHKVHDLSNTFLNIWLEIEQNLRTQSEIAMGMRVFCAQAQKQVDKEIKIYLAISSCVGFKKQKTSFPDKRNSNHLYMGH